jgi:K+-transporting ATPase ATPase A chain
MTSNGFFQIALYIAALLALAKPLGGYMARVYLGAPVGLNRWLAPFEKLIYTLCRHKLNFLNALALTLSRRERGL